MPVARMFPKDLARALACAQTGAYREMPVCALPPPPPLGCRGAGGAYPRGREEFVLALGGANANFSRGHFWPRFGGEA